jgi:hypothetical protein
VNNLIASCRVTIAFTAGAIGSGMTFDAKIKQHIGVGSVSAMPIDLQ